MKTIRVTYCALAALISAASCSKEAAEPDVYDWTDGKIHFKTSLAEVASSRAQDMTLDCLESFQVTCFTSKGFSKNEADFVVPYFEDATFIRQETPLGLTYISSPSEESCNWPSEGGMLRFFAFSPSRSVMAESIPNTDPDETGSDNYLNLLNSSTEENSELSIDYRLEKVRINPDISRQFDFVTAQAKGERWKDFRNEVELPFHHQLSQVELRAWGSGSGYDFEIAGVRLGNPVVEGTFTFTDAANLDSHGAWVTDASMVKDKVEYIYRGATAPDGQSPLIGDTIYRINREAHTTYESATSIMGNGGCAMVIPTVNSKWEGLADPNIGVTPYATDKMYFSILMRVTNTHSGKQIYPYPDIVERPAVIHLAVNNEGVIAARVYPGKTQDSYFTDPTLQIPYVAPEDVEIKEFSWAAVPVEVNWSAGNRYIYTLNYSEGIGLHDPQDPEPGKPIQGKPTISWGVSVSSWANASASDNYQPDLDVPN